MNKKQGLEKQLLDFTKQLSFISGEAAFLSSKDFFEEYQEDAEQFCRDNLLKEAPTEKQCASIELPPELVDRALAGMIHFSFRKFASKLKDALYKGYELGLTYPDAVELLGIIQWLSDEAEMHWTIFSISEDEYPSRAIEVFKEYFDAIKNLELISRLTEFIYRIKAFCMLDDVNRNNLTKTPPNEIEQLLDKDIVKAIIKALGKNKLKRMQLVCNMTYYDGGHIGSTLFKLKQKNILLHDRPFYRVNPAWYKRLNICPDKDRQ